MSAIRSAAEIREAFLRFFEGKGHTRVPSSPLVPLSDPTLLFTNAGMNQFKDVFTGREQRPYTRATSAQKCVRAGGKHNDLDNVGHTARHHTFFEMLGNFSFGDYFKQDAIAFAWEFVTSKKWLGIDPSLLAVTIFEGEGKIPPDDEAREHWRSVGVQEKRIFRLGKKDNFWQMGDMGPCGPCSEIHIFRGPERDRASIDDHAKRFFSGQVEDSDSWMELWNLVFMQFEMKAGGELMPLPKPSIDTGAGLERLAAVIQGVRSNYDTDILWALIEKTYELAGTKHGTATPEEALAARVIADHSRATAFLVADGVLPSNEGRGYVLRRIMRRAIRHGANVGLSPGPFLDKTAEKVIELMGDAYPELREQRALIVEVAKNEEASFRKTLTKGLIMLEEEMVHLKKDDRRVVPGQTVFFLYDTHGFPPDVTEQVARERGFEIDWQGFEEEKAKRHGGGEFAGSGEQRTSDIYFALHGRLGDSQFLGYETHALQGAKVLALVKDGREVGSASAGEQIELVTDRTPFYGESGGQLGDAGNATGKNAMLVVTDTQKPVGGLVVHKARVGQGTVRVGELLDLAVDADRRTCIRANHSATHLLHRALKEALGEHVKQAGSVVAPELLRFDYSHFAAPSAEELARVERRVNQMVRDNALAQTQVMPIDEAKRTGAIAMFGEKYGATVRVVSVHPDSKELCGGTHVARSGEIGFFKIVSEGGIAAGVRRIVACTGEAAVQLVEELEAEARAAAAVLRASPKELLPKVEQVSRRVKELEKEVDALTKKLAGARSGDLLDKMREVKGVKVLATRVDPADAKIFRDLADKLRDRLHSGIVALGGEKDGKVLLLVAATRDLVERGYKASDIVREIAKDVGGSGGGKPDLAQAGGTDPSQIDRALSRVYELV